MDKYECCRRGEASDAKREQRWVAALVNEEMRRARRYDAREVHIEDVTLAQEPGEKRWWSFLSSIIFWELWLLWSDDDGRAE